MLAANFKGMTVPVGRRECGTDGECEKSSTYGFDFGVRQLARALATQYSVLIVHLSFSLVRAGVPARREAYHDPQRRGNRLRRCCLRSPGSEQGLSGRNGHSRSLRGHNVARGVAISLADRHADRPGLFHADQRQRGSEKRHVLAEVRHLVHALAGVFDLPEIVHHRRD